MSQVLERPRTVGPETAFEEAAPHRHGTALRVAGALALLVGGAVHLEQYLAVHFDVVPVIGPLFLLNFIGSVAVGLGLLLPLRPLHGLLALGGIAIGVVSIVFLEISHARPLFGFEDYGYRTAIVIALAAEAVTAIALAAYLAVSRGGGRSRASRARSRASRR
jgi:hypothetical protein